MQQNGEFNASTRRSSPRRKPQRNPMVGNLKSGTAAVQRCLRYFSDSPVKSLTRVSAESDVKLNGWVQKSHKCGAFTFLHISDGLSPKQIQVLVPRASCPSVPVGSAVSISGRWQPSSGSQQDLEVLASECEVLATDVEPRYSSLSPDQMRKKVHLRARSPAFAALLRLRSKLFLKTHDYFSSRGYVHIDTPMVTMNDCEGAGEAFSIATTSSTGEEFFDKRNVYLSVSGQLHLEAMVSGISHVYTISTGLRADKQQSRNHLTEFKMLETELAFCDDLATLLALTEDFLLSSIRSLICDADMAEDFALIAPFSSEEHVACLRCIAEGPPFPRVPYAEALQLLIDKEQKVTGRGFTKQNESFLVNYHNSPIFITHFPVDQKPFYMRRSADEKVTESFDLLCPVVGELAGGSIREPSLDALQKRSPNIDWYLELRERGKPISGGFGLGFERLLQFLLGVPNIKDTIPFPRWYKHCQAMVKFKSRYILLEIHSVSGNKLSLSPSMLFSSIAENVGEFHGDFGFALCRSGLAVKVVDGDVALIRVESSSEKFVTSVLPFITIIQRNEVVLRSLFVGRSIRACEKFLIKYRRNELYCMLKTATSGVERNAILRALNDVSGELKEMPAQTKSSTSSSAC